MEMNVKVIESTMVKPISATPCTSTWLSNLDLMYPPNLHARNQYFYSSGGNCLDTVALKAALSRALVVFYPMAGRLTRAENGRIEIDCNGEGALFVEAEADASLEDYLLRHHFTPNSSGDVAIGLQVDYSKGISSYPIFLVQMTRFKCGGICLGIAMHHVVVDGVSGVHFMTTWSEIARGAPTPVPPFFDRTVLRARDPLKPEFAHVEYNVPPRLDDSDLSPRTKFSMFKLTRDQLNALKTKCRDGDRDGTDYSTYDVLAGHIWRCVSVARGLPKAQESRVYLPTDGRSRLQPPLPQGYFGNVFFTAAPVASCGELGSNPVKYAVEKVHDSLVRMDDEYLRSAIDYLEVHALRGNPFKSPNLGILMWARLPSYEVDFGWGKPLYVGLGEIPPEGIIMVLRSPLNDGGLLCAISMVEEHIKIFEKLLYDI